MCIDEQSYEQRGCVYSEARLEIAAEAQVKIDCSYGSGLVSGPSVEPFSGVGYHHALWRIP